MRVSCLNSLNPLPNWCYMTGNSYDPNLGELMNLAELHQRNQDATLRNNLEEIVTLMIRYGISVEEVSDYYKSYVPPMKRFQKVRTQQLHYGKRVENAAKARTGKVEKRQRLLSLATKGGESDG